MKSVMGLLATPSFQQIGLYINSEPFCCYNIEDDGALVIFITLEYLLVQYTQLLIDVFVSRRNAICSVSFKGFLSLTNEILSQLANSNGDTLCDVTITDCGEHLTKSGIKYLTKRCAKLSLVVIINGPLLLGSSGRFYRLNNSVLALLNEGDKFSSFEIEKFRPFMRQEDYQFLHGTDYCAETITETKLETSDEEIWATVAEMVRDRS
jgi:hypothetical protein